MLQGKIDIVHCALDEAMTVRFRLLPAKRGREILARLDELATSPDEATAFVGEVMSDIVTEITHPDLEPGSRVEDVREYLPAEASMAIVLSALGVSPVRDPGK
jgi:hypothetical protein